MSSWYGSGAVKTVCCKRIREYIRASQQWEYRRFEDIGWEGGKAGEAEDNVPDTYPPRILLSSSLLSKNMKINNMLCNILEKHGEGQLDRSCEKRKKLHRVRKGRNVLHTIKTRNAEFVTFCLKITF